MAFELPKLPYAFDALDPYIDAKTMEIHHDKHHQAYVTNLNNAVKDTPWEKMSIEELISKIDMVPENIRTAVRNNGGGHANHSMFWTIMGSHKGGAPKGAIAKAIETELKGYDAFKEALTKA